MATIYKITNNISGLCYIGKTTRPVEIRWKEHLYDFEIYKAAKKTSVPLYNAFKKDGIKNFSFEIIETNIPTEKINEKEKYYINLYNSKVHYNGYNVTNGGDGGKTWSKLTELEVKQIIKQLQDINNLTSLTEIGKFYNVSLRTIISINNGETWYYNNLKYPLRKYDVTGLTISRQQYKKIVKDIQNPTLTLKNIQQKYHLSQEQVTSINQGKNCYNGKHQYYKNIYTKSFPIRKNKNSLIDTDIFIKIFYDVLFSSSSMKTIGQKYGIQGNTLQYIINGKRRKELTKNYIVPMRKNLKINQEIFLKLYPQFIGGD